MTVGSNKPLLGVVIRDEKIKLIEIEATSSNQYRINKITESKLEHPFHAQVIVENQHIEDYAEELRDQIEKFGFNDRNAAISLSSNLVIIKKYPYDEDFSDEELVDQVDWEVKQFSFSEKDDYIIDFEKIKSDSGDSKREMVIVAVREAVIDYMKQIFKKANVRLRMVDTDVFAAIRAIQKNYECRDGEIYALICIEKDWMEFTILKGANFFANHSIPFEMEAGKSDVELSEDLSQLISKELRKLLLDNKLGEKIENFNRIFLYGDMVQDDTLELLQNTYNVRIDRANPFRRLRFAQNVSVDEYIWSRPETFTICVGLALR